MENLLCCIYYKSISSINQYQGFFKLLLNLIETNYPTNILLNMSIGAIMKSPKASNMEVNKMLNENVKKLLENSMWDLATCADGEPT